MEGCPKPSKPVSAVVIGGGIIGISTAVQLARRGVRVRVLEERPGEHSESALAYTTPLELQTSVPEDYAKFYNH